MKQPLVKLGLLVCLPVLVHTFFPVQAWWPVMSYTSSYKQEPHEFIVEFGKLNLMVAGDAMAVMDGQEKSYVFGDRAYSKLLALSSNSEGRDPFLVTMKCKGNVCTRTPSDVYFAALMIACLVLILAILMIFGVRNSFPSGGSAIDIDV